MLNDLIQIRDIKANELSSKEAELARLESELASMEDKQYKAQMIETTLKDYYAELFKNHAIDRSQEKEIHDTIAEKQAAIKKAKSKRSTDIGAARRLYQFYYQTKECDAAIKKADKAYVDELKRVFGELEIDIKRFYKKGISKIDLIDLINIMDSICSNGSKVGSIPLSFQQKVYKWQQAAKELPDDEERINSEKEEAAKQKLSAGLKAKKLELTEIRRNIKSSKQSCSMHQNELEKHNMTLNNYEQHYSTEKQRIEDDAATLKEKAEAQFEAECQEYIDRCERRKDEIQKQLTETQDNIDKAEKVIAEQKKELLSLMASYSEAKKEYQDKVNALQTILTTNRKERKRLNAERKKLSDSYEQIQKAFSSKLSTAQNEISDNQEMLEQLKAKKSSAEETAKKTFILSFGKKRELKEEVASIDLQISTIMQTIQQLKLGLVELNNEDPDRDAEHPLKNKIQDLNSLITVLEQEIQNRETQLHSLLEEDPDRDKSHPLKIRIAETSSKVDASNNSIEVYRKKLASLLAESPEQKKDKDILDCKNKFSKQVNEIDNNMAKQIADLDQEKDRTIKKAEEQKAIIEKEKKTLETLQESLRVKEKEARDEEQRLNDFHIDYLIKKFSKKFDAKDQLLLKKAAIKELASDIRKLNKEISDLEKKISSAEKVQARQAEEDRKKQIKKAKEEEKNRKEQEERQQRIKKELEKRDTEQQIIQGNAEMFDRLIAAIQTLNEDDYQNLLNADLCPLRDDGKRIITNSIVRKQYVQEEDSSDCKCYALVFVDQFGNAISEMRLIEKKAVGMSTKTSFELKAENGFNGKKHYLLMMNIEAGNMICAQEYKVNISFSNDFDF